MGHVWIPGPLHRHAFLRQMVNLTGPRAHSEFFLGNTPRVGHLQIIDFCYCNNVLYVALPSLATDQRFLARYSTDGTSIQAYPFSIEPVHRQVPSQRVKKRSPPRVLQVVEGLHALDHMRLDVKQRQEPSGVILKKYRTQYRTCLVLAFCVADTTAICYARGERRRQAKAGSASRSHAGEHRVLYVPPASSASASSPW